jgi:hypothetical protein
VVRGRPAEQRPNRLEQGGVQEQHARVARVRIQLLPPAGYFRYRVVNRFVTGGSWVFQGLLVTKGNMIANSDSGAKNRRDARTDSRLLTGQAVFSLMARVPGQDATPMQGQYGEERRSLEVQLENASGQEYNFTTDGSSTISAPGHRYVVGSAVKFTGDPTTEELPAEFEKVRPEEEDAA